jgi:hypothetical protein
MPKRKRDVDSDSPPPSQSTASRGLSRLTNTINQGTTSLKKALILARGFERQKLGRRQKAATNEPQTLLKLREEVIVLKGLDLGVVAERQLLKRLAKVKRVRENEAWVAGYAAGRGVEGVKGDAEARVVARLMGSGPVRECTDGIVERVMDVLGLEKVVVGKVKGVKLGNLKGKDAKLGPVKLAELTRGENDEWSGSESEAEDEMNLDNESDHEEGMMAQSLAQHEPNESDVDMDDSSDFSGFSARIASSSANSASSDFDSDASDEENLIRTRKPELKHTTNFSIQSQAPLSLSLSSEPKTKTKPKPPSSTTTAFLPSLMMGGYYSGSSSGSDIEDTTSNKQRKNRRGQRARQKIAEMKFGAAAKHVAKQKGGQRNAGWDPKRGGTDGNGNGKFNAKGRLRIARGLEGGRVPPAAGSSKGAMTGANGDVLGSRKREGVKEGPMHPSWEAARKRKEQGSRISIDTKGGGIGKKITFD